ncbi:MAG: hypothetical protein M3O22_08285 [Pseudomonadota bacterium]|nr:hypothetical protein [Pseudomonadota bacterium]
MSLAAAAPRLVGVDILWIGTNNTGTSATRVCCSTGPESDLAISRFYGRTATGEEFDFSADKGTREILKPYQEAVAALVSNNPELDIAALTQEPSRPDGPTMRVIRLAL